jgi:hypothetical protein
MRGKRGDPRITWRSRYVNRPRGQALFISFKLHSASGDLVPVFWLWLAVAGGRQLDVTPLKSVEKSVSASVRLLT